MLADVHNGEPLPRRRFTDGGQTMSDLDRFVQAQTGVYDQALAEVRLGRKRSHWMWFVFPQLAGLGHSQMAQRYAIKGLREAGDYLSHPVLGPRLVEICRALLGQPCRDATDVFGYPDDLKLRSSMTLFAKADNADPVFNEVLAMFYEGQPDDATLRLLAE